MEKTLRWGEIYDLRGDNILYGRENSDWTGEVRFRELFENDSEKRDALSTNHV